MRRHQFTFTPEDLRRLQALIGGEWLCVAGDTLGPDFNEPEEVIAATTVGAVTVVSDTAEADFQYGERTTYSMLAVSDDISGFEAAKRNGNVYVQHQREQVLDVEIVREVITAREDGEDTWEYTTDVGVVFVLSKGAVAIAKGSHHTEMLAVRMAGSVEDLGIPDRTVEWEDDLTVQYRSTREFIPVDALA